MKQFSLSMVPLLCAAIAPLCADNVDNVDSMISQGNNGKNGSQMSNQNKNKEMQKKTTDSQRQFEQRWRDNQITPMANPKPDGSFNPYITADFIYWKAYEEGLEYAYNGTVNYASPTTTVPSSGQVFRPDFQWEPGFKIGLGNKFAHDGWDAYLQYTWLNSKADDDEDDTDDCCVVTPIVAKSNYWLATAACPEGVVMNGEGASWNLNSFNVLDFEVGRNFYVSKFLTLRPFGGFKFSWQHQKYRVKYDDILFVGDAGDVVDPTTTIPLGSNVNLDFKQREFGVGFRMGMNTEWYLCKWLGGYGDFALTGMWNRFNETREVGVNTPAGASYDSEYIKGKSYDVTAVLEVGLGLFFEWAFSNDNYMFSLAAGWEAQVWFNQNHMIYLMANNAPGNLSFQGFTLKAGFAF